MKIPRRRFLYFVAAGSALPAMPRLARAQAYPSRPVRLLVPFAPGGATDILARLIGQWLSDRLGQPFVIENRPGAGTNLATEIAVNSPPDGYTLLMASTSGAINATLYRKLNFNLIRDIAPVAVIFRGPLLMVVNPSFPARTLGEFIAHAKANPGKISMASSGVGTSIHMSGELFKMMAGIDMVHVPYRGGALATADLLGGQVDVIFSPMPESLEYARAGRLRPLAVTTATRWESLPDVPAIGEILPGYETSVWFGVAAPGKTPVEIVERLNGEINRGLADPGIKSRLLELGGIAPANSPADFASFIAAETAKWAKVVKFSGAKAD
jgi:tripartite-type tricarboxylate transporter receptor subunit TctC